MTIAPQSFQFVDSSSAAKTGQTLPIGSQAGASSVSTTPASDLANIEPAGTPITGASMPAGGSGLTGWLSAIWYLLSGTLKVGAAANAIVDGADVTQGAKADTAATNATGAWSAIALLKWIGQSLAGYLSVNLGIGSAAVSHTNAIYIADAYANAVTAAWNNATVAGASGTGTTVSVPTGGMDGVMLSIIASGTVTAGHITFEAYDGAAWLPIKGFPLEAYYSYQGYTLATGLNNGLQFDLSGCLQFRVRLDTAITGSGSVLLTLNASSAPLVPGLVAGLDPTATNPVTIQGGAAVIGYAGSLNFQTAPVVPNLSASYSSGALVGTAGTAGSGSAILTVPVFRTTTQASATLSQILFGWTGSETVNLTAYIFNKLPTTTGLTDTATPTFLAADLQHLVCAPITTTLAAPPAGSVKVFAATSLSLSVQNRDTTVTTNLYVVIVADAAITGAASGDLFLTLSGVND